MTALNPSESEKRALNPDRLNEVQQSQQIDEPPFLGLLRNARKLSITTNGVVDTEDAFVHGLVDEAGNPRIPSGFIVTNADKGAVIYAGTTAWTDTNIYLRSNVVTVAADVWVF